MNSIINSRTVTFIALLFIIMFFYICLSAMSGSRGQASLPKKMTKHRRIHFTKSESFQNKTVLLKERLVHLDLKGAPPKLSYYSQLFPLLKKLGATGVLLEYEDMFPYNSTLIQNVSALNSYSITDIRTINILALKYDLKLVPFIQVFSDLDFLLKLENYVDYREVRDFPSTLCPSFGKSLKLIEEMVDQILKAHPHSSMLHIGCHEIPHLGHCQRCADRMYTNQLTKNDLFLDHINSVIQIVKKIRPSLEVFIWDDHFRTNSDDLPPESLMSTLRPVVWWYGKDVYEELGPSLWNMYSSKFPKIWLSSAFKGTIGTNKYMSEVNHYIQNHQSWLAVVEEYHEKNNFEGIILTGRQRYDHFAVLCELLPVAIPSLAMSLRLLQGFNDPALGPPTAVARLLQCDEPYGLMGSAFSSPKCKFPGGDILEYTIQFHQLQQEFDGIMEDSRVKGWLNDFNRKYAYSNPQHIKTVLMPLNKIKGELDQIKVSLKNALSKVYDQYTVVEWMETHFLTFEQKVLSLWTSKQNMLARHAWQRRPLNMKQVIRS